eukprot:Pompholyxophrys_punicea_v1_NODE_543_length_1718_cov_2.881539.p1 type:complete len:259 gc:universal NODE_543_length_1718_cov_2.881539:1358-582(-)
MVIFVYFVGLQRNHPSREGIWTIHPCTNKDAKDAVRKHRESKEHKTSKQIFKMEKNMTHIVEKVNDKIISVMLKKFTEIYFLCKNGLALDLFGNLSELERLNGAYDGLQDVLTEQNAKYTSHEFVSEAVECIATVIRSKVLEEFQAGKKLIGVLIDETTDISVISQLIVYYRFCNSVNGNEKVVFGGIEKLECGTADCIMTTLTHRLNKDSISFADIVSFGTDGASVMLGKHDGVATRMLRKNPFIIPLRRPSRSTCL